MNVSQFVYTGQPWPRLPSRSSPRLKLLAAGEKFQGWEAGRDDPGLADLWSRLRGDTKVSSGQNLLAGGAPGGD